MISFRMAAINFAATAVLMATHHTAAANDEAAPPQSPYGIWTTVDANDSSKRMEVMRLKVYPQAAPVPALRHRLIPAPADRTDGNSAVFYLKAMGFVEQTNARIALRKMEQKWFDEVTVEQQGSGDYPPHNWDDMSPDSLPMDQVKSYLEIIAFQEPLLFDAARRTNYSQDRAMERESNPIDYLLPEVQQMRELVRQQVVRLRYAVAEDRVDDAVEMVGQMLAMANHIGGDEFLVACLTGVSIEGIAIEQGLALSQHPNTPNLYWAIAACPQPMVDFSKAMESERQSFIRQFPLLKEVDETVRPEGFWSDFSARMIPQWNKFATQWNVWNSGANLPENVDQFQLAWRIATQYESARQFLADAFGMQDEQLDRYPKTQVVFLAMVKYHAIAADEAILPFYLSHDTQQKWSNPSDRKRWRSDLGWIAEASETTLLRGDQFVAAVTRGEQLLALWQIVEAIRMTASTNGGQPPKSLDDLVVPAPLDPVANKPFEYTVDGQTITVTGVRIRGTHYQLIIELAKSKQEEN